MKQLEGETNTDYVKRKHAAGEFLTVGECAKYCYNAYKEVKSNG